VGTDSKHLGQLIAAMDDFKKGDVAADDERAFLLGNTLINVFGENVAKGVLGGLKDQVAS
jgi:hypothetical protein